MLNKLKKSNQKGFTIIEVMIVLAIAGLILLVVLLAVPALQRSSRNTAIKNDAAATAAAISEYESNNDGKLPAIADINISAGTVTVGASTSNQSKGKVQGATTKATLTGRPVTGTPAGLAVGTLGFRINEACDGSSSPRAMAVYYATEGSNTGVQCVDV